MGSTDERRRHLRYTHLANSAYTLNPSKTGEIFECAVVNVSDSGLNLFVSEPLDIGQEILIRGDLPDLARRAVVRWTKKLGGFYAAGLELMI